MSWYQQKDGAVSAAPNLPMDGFSIRARAAVELGQQSENAKSYLDRKTDDAQSYQEKPGTSWPQDQVKAGSICQVIVRDTGFNMGTVLWRSVGLLFEGIGAVGGSCRFLLQGDQSAHTCLVCLCCALSTRQCSHAKEGHNRLRVLQYLSYV